MASTRMYVRDLKRRMMSSQFYSRRKLLLHLLNDLSLPFGLKKYASVNLFLFGSGGSLSSVRNRCIYTYRARSISSQFKVSRLVLRDLIWKLLLPGARIASW